MHRLRAHAVFTLAITAALLLASPRCRGRQGSRPGTPAAAPPIVLISIDTLRADHLPAYGYKGVGTPAIDGLARDGVLFQDVWSQCPLTLPSHVSILTGLLPPRHGVRNNIGYRLDAGAHATLARLLKARGYATGGAVSAWVLRGATGIADSFDFYDDAIERPAGSQAASQVQRAGPETVERAIAWLEKVRARPFFLFLHLYEPHAPYEPPEPYRSRSATPYDGEIAAADASVGVLIQKLRDWSLYDRSLIVLLSDHGEGLMDHGEQEHGILLYREALRVPLVLKLPGGARRGERVAHPAALVDVLPTMLGVAGISAPADASGRDLLRPAPAAGTALYSETFYPRIHLGWSELRSLFDGRLHYIDGPEPELYDIASDPAERDNRYPAGAEPARDLKRRLNGIPADFKLSTEEDPEQLKKLAALGYIAAKSPSASAPALPSPMRQLPVLEEIRQAFRLANDGRRKPAIAAFRALLAKNPNLFDIQYKLALTLEAEGRLRESADAFRAAIHASPTMATEAALPLARVSLAVGDLEAARANAELALADASDDANEILARVALSRGQLDEAERRAAAVSAGGSRAARAAVIRANVRLGRNQPADALALVDAALAALPAEERPKIPDAQYVRGDALARLDRYAEADAAFRAEIRAFPTNADAYTRLAVLTAVEHKNAREVYAVLDAMYAANPGRATAEAAAKALDSIGDKGGAAVWRKRAGG